MPVISAFADHPTHPYVRVEANWADTPSVTHAAVYRVDVETGECTPLRPYICYDGWELLLSCGHGTWWDTEAPFDRPFYYITTSSQAPCLPTSTMVLDSFGRTLVDSWGSTESGTLGPLAYALSGGTVPDNYDVTAGRGLHTLDSAAVFRFSLVDISTPNFDAYGTVSVPAIALTAAITTAVVGRYTNASNHYYGRISFGLLGAANLQIAKVSGGVGALVSNIPLAEPYFAGQDWRIRFQGNGSALKVKAWPATQGEPAAWGLEATDTDLTTGNLVGLASRRDTGNTNGTIAVSWDDFEILDPCQPCEPVSATAPTEITLASDGRFWLKDPVRPCHDRPVPLCQTDAPLTPPCGGSGILFVGTGPEIYPANSFTLRPMNRRRNLSATRPRGDAASALRLQTMTFTDRDDLLQLVAPGSLLLWQGPAEYGISDRYMDVKDVQVSPELPDLRIPIRSETLPYDIQDRPAGPTQGICGARVADICALYPTWNDLAATGMTWDDLVAGQASPVSANPARRTWNDVNAGFADWDAVNTSGRTWDGLEVGD
jgi:hypothetical protein